VVGDLNADGTPDLAVANFGSNTASVLLGSGGGSFGTKADYEAGAGPRSIVIGDLNQDGKPDLGLGNFSGNTISVLLGNGDGSFGAKADYGTGAGPRSVAIGDLNADGKTDLVAANHSSDDVSVLLGNGDGTFGPAANYRTGPSPLSVGIGDLNADGRPDLAVATSSSNAVSVLFGNGDGTFGSKTDFGTGNLPFSVAIGDLNADGRPDLVVVNRNSSTVSVLLNLGSGTSATLPVMVSVQSESGSVRISWFSPAAHDLLLTVHRRTAESNWVGMGQPTLDANNRILFEDNSVTPGARYGYRLLAQVGGRQEFSSEVWVLALGETGAPSVLRLSPGFPNPLVSRSQFNYGIPKAGQVRLVVYDLQGRRVATVIDQIQARGWRSVVWDGRDERHREVASGAYFARLESDGQAQVRKIVIAR
jgi:hypothetical protein